MDSEGKVDFYIEDNLAEITIDHPPANVLNRSTLTLLEKAMQSLSADESVRVVIIRGKGDKFFAGGADINEFSELNQETGKTWIRYWHKVFAEIYHSPKIVIAAINGFALGGGCELALACDLRVAAENAKLGQPEVRYSIIPAAGGTQRLPRIVGLGRAKELILTGDVINACEAFEIGLVNRVVSLDKLMDETRTLAEKIILKGPIAISLAKKAINLAMDLPLSEGLGKEIEFFSQTCGTEDKNEGVRAFFEKRLPQFNGR